jgi:hypothetical protein
MEVINLGGGTHLVQCLKARYELGKDLLAREHAEGGVELVPKAVGCRRSEQETANKIGCEAHPADFSILTMCSSAWWKYGALPCLSGLPLARPDASGEGEGLAAAAAALMALTAESSASSMETVTRG